MGNYSVVSDIGSTLIKLLIEKGLCKSFDSILNSSDLSLGLSDEGDVKTKITLFLYKIDENAFMKNQGMGGSDDSYGKALCLDLHYLLIVSCKEDKKAEQKILGKAMQIFYENALVSGNILQDGLQGKPERIKILFETFSLDELSKIWTAFPKLVGKSMISYTVTPVTIEASENFDEPRIKSTELRYVQIEETDDEKQNEH